MESLKPCAAIRLSLRLAIDPIHQIYDEIKGDYPLVYNLGDGREVRNIRGAIWDAHEVARNI